MTNEETRTTTAEMRTMNTYIQQREARRAAAKKAWATRGGTRLEKTLKIYEEIRAEWPELAEAEGYWGNNKISDSCSMTQLLDSWGNQKRMSKIGLGVDAKDVARLVKRR